MNTKKISKKKVLAGLGALAVVIGVGTAVSGGGGGTSHQPTAAVLEVAKKADVGTTVKDGKFEFTITKITNAKSVGDTEYGLGHTAQGKYTNLHVTVKNIGTELFV